MYSIIVNFFFPAKHDLLTFPVFVKWKPFYWVDPKPRSFEAIYYFQTAISKQKRQKRDVKFQGVGWGSPNVANENTWRRTDGCDDVMFEPIAAWPSAALVLEGRGYQTEHVLLFWSDREIRERDRLQIKSGFVLQFKGWMVSKGERTFRNWLSVYWNFIISSNFNLFQLHCLTCQ